MDMPVPDSAAAPDPGGEVRDVSLEEALGERYLAYALATITSRSLPDVRDGLKPVQRRLLYAMLALKLDPSAGFKKCARVVGDVIGKFHPHGEQAVYDAMVRLAQAFAARYPLVDGQGNFGNVDGDGAAAMRYTEARLTAVAGALLDGIDEDAVDLRPTYDGEEDEPLVLPAAFPNLLANGAVGIAVGMATSIPPHNVAELCDALLHLIKRPQASVAKLVAFVPGPDFPTGGVLVESPASVAQAYRTGRGGFRLRAAWTEEKQGRGAYLIVVTEIPFQVAKSRLIEQIADLINARKLPMLAGVRDESAEDVRLVLEPRSRTVDAQVLMEALFRATDLEVRVPLNLNVLDRGRVPRVMDLRGALQAFLDHRLEVLRRRTRHRLGKAQARLEVLSGYLVVYRNLDEIIRIIREAEEAKPELIRAFRLSETQAEAILDLRLRRLRKLDEKGIHAEFDELTARNREREALLADEKAQWKAIATEIRETKKRFGSGELGDRRTAIGTAPARVEVPAEALVEREPITVICSAKGWIRAANGHLEQNGDVRYKEGDAARFWVHAESTDRIQVFATNGRFYTLAADKLPGGRGAGDPVRLMIDLPKDEEVVALDVHTPGRELLVASSDGRGFRVNEDQTLAQTRNGRQVLNLAPGAEAVACRPADGDTVAVVGENRKLLLFPAADLPVMARGRGVVLQRTRDGGLADAMVFDKAQGLRWRSGARTRTQADLGPWMGKRGQAGRLAPKGFPKTGRFA